MILFKSRLSIVILLASLLCACVTQSTNPYDTDSDSTKRARAHTELGAAYYQQGKYDIALSEFNIAIEFDPDYAWAHNGLGLVQSALGEKDKADASFRRALQLQPDSPESHNNYGNFLCNNGRYAESVAHFLAAVKNPLYSTPNLAYTNAGICSLRNKDITDAEKYFIKALQIQPLTHEAAYQLAKIQFDRGDASTAFKTLQNALTVAASPTVLWLGIEISRALNNKDNEASYAIQLRKQYPDSAETKMLISGQK
jgi:type IV pilus assembly protein PilF